MSCDDPNASEELKSACACKKAVTELTNSYTAYQAEIAAQAVAAAKYNTEWAIYQKRYGDWLSRSGEFAEYKNHGKNNEFWANSHDGTCWWGENWNGANDWCKNAANNKGYDGENYSAKEWGWCSGRWGNFLCKKSEDIVILQERQYQSVKPIPPAGGADGIVTPCSTCKPPTNNNVLCCDASFESITAGKNVTINSVINCAQDKVDAAIAASNNDKASGDVVPTTPTAPTTPSIPTIPAPMDTIQAPPQTPPPEPSDPSGVPPTDDNNSNGDKSNDLLNLLLSIVIVIVMLSCISSVFSVLFR